MPSISFKDLLLQAEIFGRGLDDEIGAGKFCGIGRRGDGGKRFRLDVLGQLLAGNQLGQVIGDRLRRARQCRLIDIADDHFQSRCGADLRDAGPHQSRSDDANCLDRHGRSFNAEVVFIGPIKCGNRPPSRSSPGQA
jgi:hypothetical protein